MREHIDYLVRLREHVSQMCIVSLSNEFHNSYPLWDKGLKT